jgi:4-hydroxy-tetrahydrodipicolinate synthase
MLTGCYTALVTPFDGNGVDEKGLDALLDFQVEAGVKGVLAVGTTGESPTLSWSEHNRVVEMTAGKCKGRCQCIAGTGSNNTREALEGTKHAAKAGVQAVLLVDPYYNGPSSLEIRREYVEPVAKAFPGIFIIPYVIPGRTGAQLLPQDIGILAEKFKNVSAVKEATGNLENMRLTRAITGDDFAILSGDDDKTLAMMADSGIRAGGVVSVMSNIAPKAVVEMVTAARQGDMKKAERLQQALKPLFGLVTVTTTEESPHGPVNCRARNPLPIKTIMAILGMPGGGCRQPLGKMTKKGLDAVVSALGQVWRENPEILQPAADFFKIDISARLNDPSLLEGLAYSSY